MHRIAQITDIHLSAEGETTQGIDVHRNFEAALGLARARGVDELVLTGDLCVSAGVHEVYVGLRERLEACGLPYRLLAGNHDDPAMIAEVFEQTLRDGELCGRREVHGRTEIFLDTSPNELSQAQCAFLAGALSDARGEAIVWMHHPPCLSGVRFMDGRYPLRNHAEVTEIFAAHGRPAHVFVGHYHAEVTAHAGPATVYVTPSTYFQLRTDIEDFEIADRRPGLRFIEFDGDDLRTEVAYVPAGFTL